MKRPDVAIIVGSVLASIGLVQIGNGAISDSMMQLIVGLALLVSGGIFIASGLSSSGFPGMITQ